MRVSGTIGSAVFMVLWGSGMVWRRNATVFARNFTVNIVPPFLEPLLYLGAIGFGIGMFVEDVMGMPFVQFISPGIFAGSVMFASFYECAYGTYVRMYYQRTFDAILATPITLREVIIGEILWGATRGFISACVFYLVLVLLGLVPVLSGLVCLPLAFLAGICFSAIAACFSAITPSIDALSYPSTLYVSPMFLFSGTFFPISVLPEPVQIAAFALLPLAHLVALSRSLMTGLPDPIWMFNILWLIVAACIATAMAIRLFERKLIV